MYELFVKVLDISQLNQLPLQIIIRKLCVNSRFVQIPLNIILVYRDYCK